MSTTPHYEINIFESKSDCRINKVCVDKLSPVFVLYGFESGTRLTRQHLVTWPNTVEGNSVLFPKWNSMVFKVFSNNLINCLWKYVFSKAFK